MIKVCSDFSIQIFVYRRGAVHLNSSKKLAHLKIAALSQCILLDLEDMVAVVCLKKRGENGIAVVMF